jgi:hypothetical protein
VSGSTLEQLKQLHSANSKIFLAKHVELQLLPLRKKSGAGDRSTFLSTSRGAPKTHVSDFPMGPVGNYPSLPLITRKRIALSVSFPSRRDPASAPPACNHGRPLLWVARRRDHRSLHTACSPPRSSASYRRVVSNLCRSLPRCPLLYLVQAGQAASGSCEGAKVPLRRAPMLSSGYSG